MEMRELKGDDLFPLLEIIGKLDIKDEFVALFDSEDGPDAEDEQAVEKRGMGIMANLLQAVLKNIGSVRKDLNALLADLCGVNPEEIKELGLTEYVTLLKDFFTKPELADFFKSIASLPK